MEEPDQHQVQKTWLHRWHTLHADEAVAAAASHAEDGLSDEEARRRLQRFGPNTLPESTRRSWMSVWLGQFKSPLIYLLFAAAGIALALGHVSDAIVIFTVVSVNAFIGTFQEGRAERSLEALRRLATHQARVRRAGRERMIEAREVVPGDILLLQAGDAVAADARLLHGAALQIAEAALTGESVPVDKHLLPLALDTPLADRKNMVYAGTHVTAGRARAVVAATGLATELGRIAALAESAEQPPTPLERRLARFSRTIMGVAGGLFALITGVGVWRGMPLGDIVMLGISQVVGLIPEGLPVAMTIALAVGVQRMARRRAVIRRLSAVETLGSITVICSDKTGTLTRNEMTVTALALADGRAWTVTGSGYDPRGRFVEAGRDADPSGDPEWRGLLEAGVLCNDAEIQGPGEGESRWTALGDPTEAALVVLAIKGGLLPAEVRSRSPRTAELPFDAGHKLMATQHAGAGGPRVIVKGAPEAVLALCGTFRRNGRDAAMDEPARRAAHEAVERMAGQALRVLAIGVVEGGEIDGRAGFAAFAHRVTFLGLLGQIDPPRPEVKAAVERCRLAGIRPVMVTGDHRATGQAIARALDVVRPGDAVMDGRELDALSDEALSERIGGVAVFARVHPAQKLRIVEAYQRRGEVVAMTGDGVNDAPALVQADVGVAMGLTGTAVAKEAAKMVIADDHFATIVAAVEEGRVVYRNLKKVVLLLLSTSAAEVVILFLALLGGYPAPFAAVQILWNNLVTEGMITVNLIMEPPEGDEMRRPPIPPGEPIVTPLLLSRMAVMGACIVASTLGWWIWRLEAGVPEALVRTETFTLLAICEWFNVLNCRSEWKSSLNFGLLKNPWLVGGLAAGMACQALVIFWPPMGRWFHTVPISLHTVLVLGAVGSAVFWVEELRKIWVRRRLGAGTGAMPL